jgi:hypothetical protein
LNATRRKGALILLGVWVLAAGIIGLTRESKPTLESVIAYVRQNDLRQKSPVERERIVAGLVRRQNELTFEQRTELRRNELFFQTVGAMTSAERLEHLAATFPSYSKLMMEAIYKMPRDQRPPFVDALVNECRRYVTLNREPESRRRVQQIIGDSLRAWLETADPRARAEMKPVFDQMQAWLVII